MKKLSYLIVLALILGLVLTGCSLLSNISQVPAIEQNGISYLTKTFPPTGLVGWWRFNGDATDSSGTIPPNNGTVVGATYDPSPMGQALSLVGLNDYVEVGDAPELRFSDGDSITIEAWVQPAAATALGVIVQKGGITDNNTNYVLRQAGKKVDFFYRGVDNAWHGVRTNADVLSPLEWNRVAVTYTFGTPESIIIYVNGIPCAVSWLWLGSADPIENDQTLRFGGQNYWAQKYYGLIDDVRIWNVALSPEELGKVYDFYGFFPPVDNPGDLNEVVNVAKAGSAIPVKFNLSGYQDLDIFEKDYPRSQSITCTTFDTQDGIIETVTAGGGSSLSYDAEADQYIYVWKTDKQWGGNCRQLEVKLNDGKSYYANFKFK